MGFFTLETAQAHLDPGGDFGPWIWDLQLKAEHVSADSVRLRLPYSDRIARMAGAIRLGELMLSRHALVRTDVFSHTAAGKPFLAFEWGSEVAYAAVERLGGLALVSVLAGLVLALTFALPRVNDNLAPAAHAA